MDGRAAQRRSESVVAIVGGGASAALTAAHLLLRGDRVPPRVVVFDRDGRHGLGQAYATEDPRHLLNAPAARMSAFADDPDHLVRWARARGLDASGADFLPRTLYGCYLQDLLAEASARHPGKLTQITATVTGVEPGRDRAWHVHGTDGASLEADAVVLATGNRAPTAWPWAPDDPRYIADPWRPGALDGVSGGPVLIVGTGLTMVDVATTIASRDPGTIVYAASRHGLLPRAHRSPAPPAAVISPPPGELTVTDLLHLFTAALASSDGEWRGVVDGLRPHVPDLWGRLRLAERQRFLSSYARQWEVRRHRIPPATATRIDDLRATGRLRVLRGLIDAVDPTRDHLKVTLATDGPTRELDIAWIINSTGPAADPRSEPLLRGLLDSGLVATDPLRLGLTADSCGCAVDESGRTRHDLFTLGPTLRGLRYETTAIPEIREQAAHLASAHLAKLSTPVERADVLTSQPLLR
ncbi:FAD/NAD(P)-binding protein [Spirillospora sp. NPDC047279]|uniref:FAD/NAD(P)-binding protein n=1 Tax=Spirillospora sp. NPDC047279 TaxID=3155478 RepID=UPI0033D475AC